MDAAMTSHPAARLLHAALPRRLVNLLWSMSSDIKDLPARLRSSPPTPWRVVHNVGGGDFHRTGARIFRSFKQAVNLQPGEHVLDIGCGAGRVAFPIAGYLDANGRYTGFDIAARPLAFARRHVSGAAKFDFIHLPAANREYAVTGPKAAQIRFPAEDASIDAALAVSVFSHLMPEDAQAYLQEAFRVLRPGGRFYLTGFFVDADIQARLESGRTGLALRPAGKGVWAADPRRPERAIGFDRDMFLDWAQAAGLRPHGTITPGHWSQPDPAGEFQDQLVLAKPETQDNRERPLS